MPSSNTKQKLKMKRAVHKKFQTYAKKIVLLWNKKKRDSFELFKIVFILYCVCGARTKFQLKIKISILMIKCKHDEFLLYVLTTIYYWFFVLANKRVLTNIFTVYLCSESMICSHFFIVWISFSRNFLNIKFYGFVFV